MNSFLPLWKPPFISVLMPEDRCHLNGFAMDGNRVRFATAFAPTDKPQGYRSLPNDSGIIIDVDANAVVVAGLIKPHSPRVFHDQLYVLNSASGEVLRVDLRALDRESGQLIGMLRLAPGVEVLFDFAIVPGFQRPLVLDAAPDAKDIGIETPAGSYWMAAGQDLRRPAPAPPGGDG